MRLHRALRLSGWRGFAAAAALSLAGCSTLNVVSDGADGNLMLQGHDPVGYFTAGIAMRGRPELKAEHRGGTYRFANETNRRLFVSSPERYAPQFGGFCANGMVYAVPIAGATDAFKIVEGRLYMFAGRRSKQYFEMDQERNLGLASRYWESEVRDSDWRLQSFKRLLFRVPHYRTGAQLAEEYEKRYGRAPG